MSILETIIIAIVEGLTEFLPVSSTGHMIIAQNAMGVESTVFVKAFTFIIQFGAILSVVVLYWRRFFKLNRTPAPKDASPLKRFLHKYDFYWKLFVAFIPAAVLGLLFSDAIDAMLESVQVVAVTLILGGIFMLYSDKIFNKGSEKTELTEKRAFRIGFFQCISMIPGVSRSMATIVGGMSQKLTRKAAAEFSFFLAVNFYGQVHSRSYYRLIQEQYWAENEDNTFEVLDGQQRTISICQYVSGVFSIDDIYFHNLTDVEQNQILDYELMIYVCEGNDKEKLVSAITVIMPYIGFPRTLNQGLTDSMHFESFV